jgi:tetratricopeptide (TPR) repeat protein
MGDSDLTPDPEETTRSEPTIPGDRPAEGALTPRPDASARANTGTIGTSSPPAVEQPASAQTSSRQELGKKYIKEHRWKLPLWIANTIAATLFGVWLGDVISCVSKAGEKIENATENAGFFPYGEGCFLLPPLIDPGSNKDELALAESRIIEAERALDQCAVPCFFHKECRRLKREIELSKANLDLLRGECKGALQRLEQMKHSGGLSREAAITWAWAKVEADPSADSYRQAIDLLRQYKDEDACLATTRGSLLRRLALSWGEEGQDHLLRTALAEHEKAMSLNSRSVLADYNRAIVLLELGETGEAQSALDHVKDILRGRLDPYWHHAQAKIHDLAGEDQKALDELTAAVESGHLDPEFRLARGWIWLRLGQNKEAERDFNRARSMTVREDTSCRRVSQRDLEAEVIWGLAWVQYKEQGPAAVDIDALRSALAGVSDPRLREEIAADLSEFEKRRKAAGGRPMSGSATPSGTQSPG